LPDIEKFIGHRIPTGSYAADELPKIKQPPYVPRKRPGGRHGKPSGNRGGNSGRSRRR